MEVKNLNNLQPETTQPIPLKFITENCTSLIFIDVLVSLTDTGIKSSLYRKPTDRPTYLMHCMFHPHHIKSSIVFSQLLKLKLICSDISYYKHEVKFITQSLLSRGYPCKLISEQINRVSHITRTKSLTYNSNNKTNEKRITYNRHQSLHFEKGK